MLGAGLALLACAPWPPAANAREAPPGAATPKPEQTSAAYQPAGAPANPRVAAQWNRYHDYAAATDLLKQLAAAHPELCKLQSLGKSYGGREMWVLTITNFKQGTESREARLLDRRRHSCQRNPGDRSRALHRLVSARVVRPQARASRGCSNERVFYLMPMMSPDSRDAHMHEPNTDALAAQRPAAGRRRPRRAGRRGQARRSRRRRPHHADAHSRSQRPLESRMPTIPSCMVRAKPDEKGEFTLLGEEGFDNDGDGRVNEDGDGLLRSQPQLALELAARLRAVGAHTAIRSRFSKNRMVADFIAAHPNIAGAQSYHNAGGMILRGPAAKQTATKAPTIGLLEAIAKKGEHHAARLSLHGHRQRAVRGFWRRGRLALQRCTACLRSPTSCSRLQLLSPKGRRRILRQARGAAAVQQVPAVRRRLRAVARGRPSAVRQESKSAGSRRTGSASRRRSCWKKNAIATWRSRCTTPIRCRWSRSSRSAPSRWPMD